MEDDIYVKLENNKTKINDEFWNDLQRRIREDIKDTAENTKTEINKDVEIKISNLVERGHNERGYYEKYSDGTLKCWGSKEFGTVDINTAFGTLFVSKALTLDDFAVPFVDKPVLTKWLENGSSSSWLINGLPYSTIENPRRCESSCCCNRRSY